MYQIYLQEGIKQLNENNPRAAADNFYLAHLLSPEAPAPYFYLGLCHLYPYQIETAIPFLIHFISVGSNEPKEIIACAYDLLGQCFEFLDDALNALQNYSTALIAYPTCSTAWHNLGMLCLQFPDLQIQLPNQEAAAIGGFAHIWIAKGEENGSNLLSFLDSKANAFVQYCRKLEASNQSVNHIKIAYQKAMIFYKLALGIAQNDAQKLKLYTCVKQYAQFLFRKDLFQNAITVYELALTYIPQQADVLFELGICYQYLRQPARARDRFSDAIKYTTDNKLQAASWLYLAFSYRTETMLASAQVAINRAIALDQNNDMIKSEKAIIDSMSVGRNPHALFPVANSNATNNDVHPNPSFSTR